MDLFFGAVWCFFGEAILSYCETKSASMCRKTNSSGTSGSTLISLTDMSLKVRQRRSFGCVAAFLRFEIQIFGAKNAIDHDSFFALFGRSEETKGDKS